MSVLKIDSDSQSPSLTLSAENMKKVVSDLINISDINAHFSHGYRFVDRITNEHDFSCTLIFASPSQYYFAYDYDPLIIKSCFSLEDAINPDMVYEVQRREKVVYEYFPTHK